MEQFGRTAHRRRLLAGLERAANDLRAAGCRAIYLDGSFVTSKEVPADFDACWDRTGVDLRKLLETPLWTFERGRAAQKAAYGGELLPADVQADANGRRFLDFFQVDKETGEPKGIVALDLEDIP
ncbi:MAG: hypothetical protein M3Q10_07710 [Chloroflexota bacterium]|nr:hypothetical protein [Chloroflexota bacterium]